MGCTTSSAYGDVHFEMPIAHDARPLRTARNAASLDDTTQTHAVRPWLRHIEQPIVGQSDTALHNPLVADVASAGLTELPPLSAAVGGGAGDAAAWPEDALVALLPTGDGGSDAAALSRSDTTSVTALARAYRACPSRTPRRVVVPHRAASPDVAASHVTAVMT